MDLARYLDPNLIQQVERLDLRARFIIEGFLAGLHRSPLEGSSAEFSEHRRYSQGDDPRLIDWSVFARTDRLFVRKYAADTHLACHLFVDTSASMGYVGSLGPATDPRAGRPAAWPQPPAKLLYAVHVAAALGYLVTSQQDTIGLALLGEGLDDYLPPRSTRQHLAHLLSLLTAVVPRGQTGLCEAVHAALARVRHRGLVVLLSDLLTDAEALDGALEHIRYRGHDLIVMHILDAAEVHFRFRGRLRLEDPETGAHLLVTADEARTVYLDAIAAWRERLNTRLSGLRADYVPLDTSQPFDRALVEFLGRRSRRR